MHQKLTLNRLQDLLEKTTQLNVAVVGDFCMEQTLGCQSCPDNSDGPIRVGNVRYGLAGAGRIVQLLAGVGVRAIRPFGIVGNDGFGWQLMKLLQPLRCDLDDLCVADNWLTPVTIACGLEKQLGEDKKRKKLPPIEIRSEVAINKARVTELLQNFAKLVPHVDLVIVYDCFPESNTGLFSSFLRGVISEIASKVRSTPFMVESRHFIDQYTHVITRINANQLLESDFADSPTASGQSKSNIHVYEELQSAAMKLRRQTLKPVFVSLGEKGVLTCDGGTSIIPALPVTPPVDRSSVGDCITAVAATAMACDASPIEAAQMAMLAANVVMHQRTFPSLATRSQLIERFEAINQLSDSRV